ncbi:MAG: WYL domain-containing protein [Clostridia bacterium]|nr:WYL domain-containing protein [Clostridia bacterium]
MARSENQKLKLFYLVDILREETDEKHSLSMVEIIEKLSLKGIKAERKSLYDDIALLADYGIYIEKTSDHRYYIAEREYELAELKTLVDIIQASQFLTNKKSRELTKKLYRETSRYGAAELDRQVHTAFAKAPNEKIFYTVDAIHSAIRDDKRIEFSYFRYNEDKKLVERKANYRYLVSPIALVFDNENYYLVAYNEKEKEIRHYRVDRIQNVTVLDDARSGAEVYGEFDISKYENKTFGMFGGNEALVTLNCKNEAAGAIIDRFGDEPTFIKHGDGTFDVTVRVFISEQFFGWITGIGRLVKIKAPDNIVKSFKEYLKELT